ncbi:hypothetical protein Anas_12974 [Armadillidium nasatum]|uniref:Uncharacterized protein n=1 Tax=Armadillidium nasatum TaxID=96803 RepID=A0A5N5TAT1_9CRUS|nr:hypothetical protein Anas_12974 [Armadillidium nasatum]
MIALMKSEEIGAVVSLETSLLLVLQSLSVLKQRN